MRRLGGLNRCLTSARTALARSAIVSSVTLRARNQPIIGAIGCDGDPAPGLKTTRGIPSRMEMAWRMRRAMQMSLNGPLARPALHRSHRGISADYLGSLDPYMPAYRPFALK